MKPLAIIATGMMTGVGMDAPSSCAAIRCAIDRFEETRFMDKGGEWIIGSAVPLTPPSRGREKLLRMAVSAVGECLANSSDLSPDRIALLLCLSEPDRPGRFVGLDDTLLGDLQESLDVRFHAASKVIAEGRVGGARAVSQASELIDGDCDAAIIAGVDTFLVAQTLEAYENRQRMLTSNNSNGFIPGEAAAAVLLRRGREQTERALLCLGVGFGMEKATVDSEEPLRADGMAEAFRAAVSDSQCGLEKLDYRFCDANGEQYRFKEASLALSRTMRVLKCIIELWHPADCIGEIGAAIVPCVLGVARMAAVKGYAPGKGVLCHFGNDDQARAAMILRYSRHGGG